MIWDTGRASREATVVDAGRGRTVDTNLSEHLMTVDDHVPDTIDRPL